MLIVFFAIALIAAVFFVIWAIRSYDEVGPIVFAVIFCVVTFILGAIIINKWSNVATEFTIDEKIAMYQEENERIESEIDAIVKEYMAHEKETFEEFSPNAGEGTLTMISLFPELNSDTLIQQQISIHAENSKQIKRLKEEKINLSKDKWALYFGH